MSRREIAAAAHSLFPPKARNYLESILDSECPDQHVHYLAAYAAMEARQRHIPTEDWLKAGGFKRMYNHIKGRVRLMVQPTSSTKVIRMVLKEVCLQKYLSMHGVMPPVFEVHMAKAGTLTQPIYECYYTMQKLDGTLIEWLRVRRTRDEILDMMIQVVTALSRMQSMGIKHNDAKLDNIMYVEVDGGFQWYLIDLGLATVGSDEGCDLWFFMWWMWYRAYKALCMAGAVRLCRGILQVGERRLPDDILKNIKCGIKKQSRRRFVDFTDPKTPYMHTNWVNAGIDKDTLYKIGSRLQPPHVAHASVLESLEELRRQRVFGS